MFGWDAAPDPVFVFFATQDRALYSDAGTVLELEPAGVFPAGTYGPFTLELGPGDTVADATRHTSARIKRTLDDGFEMVRPLVVLQTCQGATDPAF